MRSALIILTVLVLSFQQNPLVEAAKFDDQLREFVEYLRLHMSCGYEPAGIPPLAPYHAEEKDFALKNSQWE